MRVRSLREAHPVHLTVRIYRLVVKQRAIISRNRRRQDRAAIHGRAAMSDHSASLKGASVYRRVRVKRERPHVDKVARRPRHRRVVVRHPSARRSGAKRLHDEVSKRDDRRGVVALPCVEVRRDVRVVTDEDNLVTVAELDRISARAELNQP